MEIELAGATALEVIRKVRLSDSLILVPVDELDTSGFAYRRGTLAHINFVALGLSSPPTRTHPATIRVRGAADRRRREDVRCLLFPKQLPKRATTRLARKPQGSQQPTLPPTDDLFAGSRVFVDSLPLALCSVANRYQRLIKAEKLTEGDALVRLVELLMEFCGHYGRDPANPVLGEVAESLPAVTSLGDVSSFVSSARHVKGIRLLAKAFRYARDGSRSPMETSLWIALTLPPSYGLFGFGGARLNAPIVPTPAQRSLMKHRTLTPDILWEAERTALEYQGLQTHTGRSALAEDTRRLNDYLVCGIRVIFAGFEDVRTMAALDKLATNIAESMAVNGHPQEVKRIQSLLHDDQASALRARHLAHLLPPVQRDD